MPRKSKQSMLDEAFEEESVDNAESNVPEYGDPNWSSYVLSLLTEDEKDGNGLPKCNGLRRVLFNLFDVIHSKSSDPIQVGNDVCVRWEVRFMKHQVMSIDPDNPYVPTYTISAIGSASQENCSHPFVKYLPAMADTRSEARCYRKALLLDVLASEELTANEVQEVGAAQSVQFIAIKGIVERLGIDLNKFLTKYKEEFKLKSPSLDGLSRAQATKMMSKLNNFQSSSPGTNSIPEDILRG